MVHSRDPASSTKVGGAGEVGSMGQSNDGFDRSKKSSFISEDRGKSLVHISTII